jgi:integrase
MGQSLVPVIREYIDLDKQVALYRRADLSEYTIRHYKYVWKLFTDFMAPKDAWKATGEDVARWMVSRILRGVTPHTVMRDRGGLHYYFEVLGKGAAHGKPGKGVRISPAREDLVKRVLRGIYRKHGRPYERKTPLLLDSLEKMIDHERSNLLCAIRNKAMFALAWGAALRVDEIRMLDMTPRGRGTGWIELSDEGVLVHLRRSKANRWGKYRELYAVPARHGAPKYCPVCLLRSWIAASGRQSGPLFPPVGTALKPFDRRINRNSIRTAIKRAAVAIGFEDRDIGGQSLRAGCLTWLSMQNVNIHKIQEHSGHKDIKALMEYIRRPKSAKDSPLTGTKWTE